MFNLPNISSKALLLSGASFAAILMTAPAQAVTLTGMTGRTSAQINATINPATNRPGGPLSSGAAAQKTSQATADFSTALARIQGQLSAQATARAAAAGGPNNLGMDPNHPGQQLPDVPNGLGAGGLAPSANITIDPSLWQNADAPTQATSGANTTVTVHQNTQKAILTWDSFNVGKNTTVHFDQTGGTQSDGTNNWIALNRIVDPTNRPSQILGNITAEGSVYLINNNGIIFGGSSQVNVHSLIASSLSFLGEAINGLTPGSTAYDQAVAASNSTFLATGISAPEQTIGGGGITGNVIVGLGNPVTVASPDDYHPSGDITIEAGANISTHVNGSQGDGGYILIAGPNVSNAGTIAANDGQAILAAGVGVSFFPNPITGSDILIAKATGQVLAGVRTATTDITPVANLTNTGLVQASRGYITLLGSNITQNGTVAVTTGVSYPGGITITAADEIYDTLDTTNNYYHRAGLIQFGAGSLTTDLPEEDGETATSSSNTVFTPGSSTLTAGSIWFQGGSLLEAPGGNVSVAALIGGIGKPSPMPGSTAVQGRILVDNGATIDVAGLDNVALPVSSTLVTIPLITQNEIADEPNQIALLGLTDIVMDSSLAGTTADGLAWVGTPILNASGYAQLISRKVDQLLINAGSITLSGDQVLTAANSSLNLDGGYIHYLGGEITTTRLLDQNGLSTSIGNANPNDVYVGVAGVNTLNHDRWGITDEYTNSLIAGGYYQPDYIQGGNAGTLTIYGEDVTELNGAMSAQALSGLKQVAAGVAPGGTPSGGDFRAIGGTFDFGDGGALAYGPTLSNPGERGNIIIQDVAPQLASFDPVFDISTQFDSAALGALDPNDPDNVLNWKTVPAKLIDAGGFATVKINTGTTQNFTVAEGTTLSVAPGGSITATPVSGAVTILGNLIAPSGTISIAAGATDTGQGIITGGLVVGPSAVISTAGQWINDGDLLGAPGADAFVNGGSIVLTASFGGSLDLESGSVLDVSSGGVLLAGGLLTKNGVPEGKGGNVSLIADAWFPSDAAPRQPAPASEATVNPLSMDGMIESAGFAGGGTLTLQGLGFQIGGDPAQAPSWAVYLPGDYFARQGFGNYQFNAMYDVTIAPGAAVSLTQKNFMPNLTALAGAATGSDLNAGGLTSLGALDPYHRQATNLTLTAGGDLDWLTQPQYADVNNAVTIGAGAVVRADAGAAITLGSLKQVTVLGSLIAPGGAITLTGDGDYAKAAGMPTDGAFGPNGSVWLGADAVLDASGTVLVNPYASQVLVGGKLQTPVIGKIVNGGSVTLSDDYGYVIAQAGSLIDVSGTAAVFDEPQAGGGIAGQFYTPLTVWSDAGSITLGAGSGLFFDGSLRANPGAPQGEGGTLTLLPEIPLGYVVFRPAPGSPGYGATGLILQQSGALVPAGLAPGQTFTDPDMNTIEFSIDRLDGSGISTLILGGIEPGGTMGTIPVGFAGDVNLSLAKALIVNASQIEALPRGATSIPALAAGTDSIGGVTVNISTPYFEIVGSNLASQGLPSVDTTAALSDGTLNVTAGFIDLENQFSLDRFGQVNLTSSGDIRLSSTVANDASTVVFPGLLFTPGNLTLKAADIYPASGETFILDAKGPQPTTITFESNGAPGTPLSAGGSLLVDADTIVQSGTLQAPFGTIVLGVGDVTDTSTQTAFDNLPLTATASVSLTSGSLTSVSADGATLPYGTTTDGTEWFYNSVPNEVSPPTLAAPPAKLITLNGASVALDQGGQIDISGGGTLQAVEWVPGTGGTRDVLSRYNISYANSTTGQSVPLYADARNVYAIVPGYSAPVAAYDPVFAQQTPTTATGQSTALAVGQAGTGDAVGRAVYLSGVPGLPAGVYTLLPAEYATLPGAFRVVQNTGASNVVPGQSTTLADGTHVVAGYFEDALNGSRSATPSQFQVQSAAVWGKYSQYNLTSADTFFAAQAASAGTPTPALPRDAGQLVLAATGSLTLGATLDTTPAKGGAPAEVDIASQDIQIVGSGETALAGYLQLSASDLDALNAGSLLIGGTRSRTGTGVTILADANSIVVSNDAADPLTGPEIILVTKTDTTGTDPNAVNGLRLDPGSVITATGTLPAGTALPITIGSSTVSGDGSLVRVSQGAQVGITRVNVPAIPLGSLTVAAGASVNGGAALLLDSSGALNFDPAATFSGTEIAVDAPSITISGDTGNAGLTGFVVGPNSLAQFANSKQVDLRSYGDLAFNGNLNLTFGENVDFSAGAFTSDGGTVTIAAPTVAFTNDLNAPLDPATPAQGSLIVDATEIDLGSGNKSLKGFGSVAMTATGGIVGQDTGSFDMGGANVTLSAPLYVADTGSQTSLTTTGTLALNGNSGTALTLTPVGGAISFTAGSIADNGATIEAPAGNVSLDATSGDLTLASGSLVSSAGVSKLFYDTTEYAPAGAITLTADQGTVNVAAGSTLDFSGADGGGAAGSLTISAPVQTVALNGTIQSNAADGYLGGSFSLNTGGAVDLDNLATELAASGVNDAITVQTHAGNLTLSADNTITAHAVSLTADGGTGGEGAAEGNITINGTIDASGNAGGEIDLYGKSSVDLEGSLIARGTSSTERGGTVNIGTVGNPNVSGGAVQLDPTYGYEAVSAANSGSITLGVNALIDVSGGTKGGLSGGTVSFRAPLLDAADNHDVNVFLPTSFNTGKGIVGSRATTLEAYAVWSTDDPVVNAAQHFDGIVDPAGWYNATGTLLAGSFADAAGDTVATWDGATLTNSDGTANDLAYYLSNDYFAPTAGNTDAGRTAHETFYGYANGDAIAAQPGTLMGFVYNFPISAAATAKFANIQNFAVTPGIELDNPDPNINGGNISILTNWNLGAGTDASHLAFRFGNQAPVITFKAENDVKVDASLTDGFFQIANPINPGTLISVPSRVDYGTYDQDNALWNKPYGYPGTLPGHYGFAYYSYTGLLHGPGVLTAGDSDEIKQYYTLWAAYYNYLTTPDSAALNQTGWTSEHSRRLNPVIPGEPDAPTPPDAALQASDPSQYLIYLSNYAAYVENIVNNFNISHYGFDGYLAPVAAPIVEAVAVIDKTTISAPAVTDNTPSPVYTVINPLPLAGASLAGGASSTYRLVAGANFASANPEALQPASVFGTGEGSVTLDGHFALVDTRGQTIYAPTLIRTGTGSIDIAAANDITLSDAIAPGVIYTAGAPNADAPSTAPDGGILSGNPINGGYDLLTSNAINPEAAGDVSIRAGNDINGVEIVDGTGNANSQFWWQWMQTGNTYAGSQITQTSINFGAFDQGVMSVGGNVSVAAGGDIANLAVSLPTTWYLSGANTVTVGGGNLTVTAGGNILSGDYFVADGTGALTAGGRIESSGLQAPAGPISTSEVSTLLATQDGVFNVSARQGVDLGGIVDPSLLEDNPLNSGLGLHADGQNYSAASALNVITTTGDVDFNTFAATNFILDGVINLMPATLNLTAFSGGLTIASGGTLYPSANGQLSLIADKSIDIYDGTTNNPIFGMPIDLLHVNDTQPVRIYSLSGNIIDDLLETGGTNAGFYDRDLLISVDKPAQIYAAGDIINLNFLGQNLHDDDVTRIVAGHDIVDEDQVPWRGGNFLGGFMAESFVTLDLAGPGTFDVEAGRNISLANAQELSRENPFIGTNDDAILASGILAVGNTYNPDLPHDSANIEVLFGVGPGVANAPFVSAYVDPAVATPDVQQNLIAFMERYDEGKGFDTGLLKDKPSVTLSLDQAWVQFQALPDYVQQIFNQQALFTVLKDVDIAYNDPASAFFHQYARGYQAINTLFPASLGYTANSLEGGKQGANTLVSTGNLDIRSSTIQTQQGGNVTILGPGGQALVGAAAAPPSYNDADGEAASGPSNIGIFTLETGNIDIFTDQSLLLAQSRVFTEQGGDMTIWSSNGDINAGKGAKTTADLPVPLYVCDEDFYCTRDARGEVTGAGIATLQSIPGAAPGNVYLIAPRGTVDAGAAGIRVSGDLFVAALAVANANNIQVQGKSVGLPPQPVTNLTLTTASTAATEAAQITQNMSSQHTNSVVQVEVTGFGGAFDQPNECVPSASVSCGPSR